MVRAVEAGLVTVVAVTVPLNVGLAVSATVPVDAGNVMVFVPAIAVGVTVMVPDVDPLSFKSPIRRCSK
jgi:MFS superfamily sulfate permease-like transporter